MKLITSHQNLDFDGLASMVACSKLHADALMAFSGNLEQEVKRFYSFYKNVLPIKYSNKIRLEMVKELILVDIHTSDRIGKFSEIINHVPVTIYDHHFPADKAIEGAQLDMKPYGATVTLLIEKLMAAKIPVNPFEATLFTLGIYADTNCLTFNNTTSNDAKALAWLLEMEANLEIVNEYVRDAWSHDHEHIFSTLLNNAETHEINHFRIGIATYESDTFVNEIGIIANKMLEVLRADAVFMIVRMESRCYIIGRSMENNVNIPFVLEPFGGAGHPRAASATIKDGLPFQLKPQLLTSLKERIKPQVVAREIMSRPVKTIQSGLSIEEANKILLRYGHTGMPVINEQQQICGIISRTDIEKAMNHHLGHAPVKAFMSHEVISISADTSVGDINELLVTHNIGRLPVMEDDQIIGIVTRTDLLKYLHGSHASYWYQKIFLDPDVETFNCRQALEQLSSNIFELLRTAGTVGDELNQNVYVVGGFVRDLMLKTDNWDIDFVTEGDGIVFAKALHQAVGGKLTVHPQFETAVIRLSSHITLDVVTARREYYEYPAALPKVEKSNIWSDLFRRDFTINCMAICLNQSSFGDMSDYFGGMKDLQNKSIRVLYNLSFIEDPTRIFRAIRFAARLGFHLEVSTRQFLQQALQNDMIRRLSHDRIREEFLHMIREQESFHHSMTLMKELGVFQALHSGFIVQSHTLERLKGIRFAMEGFRQLSPSSFNQTVVMLMQIMSEVPPAYLEEVCQILVANQTLIQQMMKSMNQRDTIYHILKEDEVDRFTIYQLLRPHTEEALMFFYNDSDDPYIRHYIAFYLLKLRHIQLTISGNDLKSLGINPGPIYRRILDNVLKAKVLGTIYDHDGELKYAENLYNRLKEAPHA
ncbi:CBS domain-containing protein [Anoxynatronum buryatiense]|uniref:tRNA nucleotidyltransferase (CCA-adding enzyme) n=1 Tax=Anoxynatronum buryatiense TaxID=489973 RepID=A0AA46AIB6_9CLOT|nr:CBS domain-containing protein [Anoxynatronum buryatiense]SMP48306.1 tRNA nucleotidyltransferase (CCA-adding enzyme) [Anoxynatronum buryatiense]